MKFFYIILILFVLSTNFASADESVLETPTFVARWLTGNIGAYNSPMPLKLEFSEKHEQIRKIKVDAGAFHFNFAKNSNEMTVWVQYPKGTRTIKCSAIDNANVVLESINLQVPTQEIRDSKNRFTAVIANDYNLFHNPRYANFILAERDVPTNWFNLVAFDEIVILDYQNLTENQLSALRNYIKSGGLVIIPVRFADASDFLQKTNITADFSTSENAVETLKNKNYILLRSTIKFHSGMIQKYKISDNLNIAEELEIIRINQKYQDFPFNLEILRNLAEYTNLDTSNYLINESEGQKNILVMYISLAIALTMLILIVGLQHFKNLSKIEKQLLFLSFCIIITVVLLFLQNYNVVDTSSFTVTLTENNNNPFNISADVKLLRINHAATVKFHHNSDFIQILSADSEDFNEKMDISFDKDSYSVKTHGQAKLYVAKLDVDESEKHLVIYRNDKKIAVTNLSENALQKLVLVSNFSGTKPATIEKFENLTLDTDFIPYRNLFFEGFNQDNPKQLLFSNLCENIVQKNRKFFACYNSTSKNNLRILILPIINQKN